MIYFDIMFMYIYWVYVPLHMSYVGYIDIMGISPNAHVLWFLFYDFIFGIGPDGQELLLLY